MTNYCGTGSGNFPKPGDPDLNGSILSAAPAFGGIDVTWTYPENESHAVAHTILYRSTNDDPDTMSRHRIVPGDFFYDRTTSSTAIEYFYWVQLVSVNGTKGEIIGPASATARPAIEQTLEMLTGQIDSGALAQKLQGELDKIDVNRQEILREMELRAQYDDSLAVAFDQLTAEQDNTIALIQEETQARATGDDAMLETVNRVFAEAEDHTAQVQQELGAFVETVNGDLETIGAYFSTQVSADGLIGGFGIYNDGSMVEAGFDVDRFWVGRTKDNKRKPFIIQDGEVFMDEAVINKLTFNKLRADDGSLIVQDGRIKADYIEAEELVSPVNVNGGPAFSFKKDGSYELNGQTSQGSFKQDSTRIDISDSNGQLRVRLGRL